MALLHCRLAEALYRSSRGLQYRNGSLYCCVYSRLRRPWGAQHGGGAHAQAVGGGQEVQGGGAEQLGSLQGGVQGGWGSRLGEGLSQPQVWQLLRGTAP